MSAARILIVDTYYPEFLRSWDFNPAATYESELKHLLEFSFGTGDSYSRTLRELGWDARDIIANCYELDLLWKEKYNRSCDSMTAEMYDVDVVFMQNLSLDLPFKPRILAGQCSCPWPGDDRVREFDIVYTSFPHYVERIQRLGVRAVFNPLAFDPIVLLRVGDVPIDRPYPVTFVGGVGSPSHWFRGMETLEAVARAIPEFKWWGYGYETLPTSSPLRDCYQGQAFGLDMYRILLQSKIVLNRHGEVAESFSNNMRMFEATGCGALLLTEASLNLRDYFDQHEVEIYHSPSEAIKIIQFYLKDDISRQVAATNGQARTLADHTYQRRMKVVSDTLQEMLVSA